MIGVVCSGGGAAGATEAGMLKAFNDIRDKISHVSGASVGALNAALFVQGDIARLESLWKNMKRKHIYRYWKMFVPFSSSFFAAKPLYNLIDREINCEKLIASHIKIYVQATDNIRKIAVLAEAKDEDFATALKGSTAIPGVFPEVPYRGTFLVDGGCIDNTPMTPLIDAGCTVIFVLHCHPRSKNKIRTKKLDRFEALMEVISTLFQANQEIDSARATRNNIKVVHLYPNIEIKTLRFKNLAAGFEDGYREAKKCIRFYMTDASFSQGENT